MATASEVIEGQVVESGSVATDAGELANVGECHVCFEEVESLWLDSQSDEYRNGFDDGSERGEWHGRARGYNEGLESGFAAGFVAGFHAGRQSINEGKGNGE